MIKSKILILLLSTVAIASAGKCPFGHGSSSNEANVQISEVISEQVTNVEYTSQILTCPTTKTKVMTTKFNMFGKPEYQSVVNGIITIFDAVPAAYNSTDNQRAHFAGCLVRLAGHDFMDFRMSSDGTTSGGSDGCVNFNDPDNMGLVQCLSKSKVASVYEDWCDKLSLADFVVIAAEAVMGRTSPNYDSADPFKAGTLLSQFMNSFKPGRTTLDECPNARGLMPNPEDGCAGLKNIFIDHIYYTQRRNKKSSWALVAAISGAHTLGGAHVENSGYEGKWSDVKEQGIFNNDYYKSLLAKGWGNRIAVHGNAKKNQWKRVDVICNEQIEMMLNTDMCLAYQDNPIHAKCMEENNGSNKICNQFQKKGSFLLAQNSSCCAWTNSNPLFKHGAFTKGKANHYCGVNNMHQSGNFGVNRDICCDKEAANSTGDCDSAGWPKGPAFNAILKFASDQDAWYKAYQAAWTGATSNGFLNLAPLGVDPSTIPKFNCQQRKWAQRWCAKNIKHCVWTGSRREGSGCSNR